MGAVYNLVVLFIFLVTLGLCNGACPNDCSKRGKCSIENVCICDELYRVAPDCSQRKTVHKFDFTSTHLTTFSSFFVHVESCPFGRAWADKASAVDTAHASAECSNLGHCNRKTVKLSFVSTHACTAEIHQHVFILCTGNLRVFRWI